MCFRLLSELYSLLLEVVDNEQKRNSFNVSVSSRSYILSYIDVLTSIAIT